MMPKVHVVNTPEIEPKMKTRDQPGKYLFYWRIYFDVGYYMGIVPFRLKKNSLTGYLEIYENVYQKVRPSISLSSILLEYQRLGKIN